VQRRPEKLGRRQSTTVYDGRSLMMMTLSEDDLEPRGLKTGGEIKWRCAAQTVERQNSDFCAGFFSAIRV